VRTSSCIYFYNRRAHRSCIRRRIDWLLPDVRFLFFVWGYEFLTTSLAVDNAADRYNYIRICKCMRVDLYMYRIIYMLLDFFVFKSLSSKITFLPPYNLMTYVLTDIKEIYNR